MATRRHPARALARACLVALLLLQVVVAPAHCLARGSAMLGGLVEICTADGLRLVQLAEDGSEAPPAKATQAGFCLACHALPHGAALDVPALPAPSWLLAGPTWAAPSLAAPPPAIRGPPTGARAPPTTLS